MKIALVVPSYRTPFGGNGGVAGVADFLAQELAPLGAIELFSLCMSRRASQSRSLVRPQTWFRPVQIRERENSPTTFRVWDVGAPVAELEWARFWPRRALDRALADFDVVVVACGSPAAAVSVRRSGRPVVLQVATLSRLERARLMSGASPLRRQYLRLVSTGTNRLDRIGLRSADAVCVENLNMERLAEREAAGRVVLCPPGIDIAAYADDGRDRQPDVALAVGRLGDPRKDFGTLIRAFKKVSDGSSEPLRLTIAGRGEPRESDTRLAHQLGMEGVVSFARDVPQEELATLLQQASVFVSSSAEEGLGIAILEAMAAGAPIVSTKTDGALFALGEPPAGILVDIGDVDGLSAAVGRVLADTGLASDLRQRSRERVMRAFSLEQTGQKFRDVVSAHADIGTVDTGDDR